VSRTRDQRGNVDDVFAHCDLVVEGTFRTPWAYQAYSSRIRRRRGSNPTARSP
jgi:hypothetical protein